MTRHLVRLTFTFAGMFGLLALVAAPAAAKTSAFTFEYDGTVTDTSCGIPLEYYDVGKGSGRAFSDNAGNFVGLDLKNDGLATYTNLETGLSVTVKYRTLFKNFNFVDNGDGTLSQDQTVVGEATLYGPTGEVLLRNHGPMTVHSTLIPTDTGPIFISQEVRFEHGAHSDFCHAIVTAIG